MSNLYIIHHEHDESSVKKIFHNDADYMNLNHLPYHYQIANISKEQTIIFMISHHFMRDFYCMRALLLSLNKEYQDYQIYTYTIQPIEDVNYYLSYWDKEFKARSLLLKALPYDEYKDYYQLQSFIPGFYKTLNNVALSAILAHQVPTLYQAYRSIRTEYEDQLFIENGFTHIHQQLERYFHTLHYIQIQYEVQKHQQSYMYLFYKNHQFLGSFTLSLKYHFITDMYQHIECTSNDFTICLYPKKDQGTYHYTITHMDTYTLEEIIEYCWHDIQKNILSSNHYERQST